MTKIINDIAFGVLISRITSLVENPLYASTVSDIKDMVKDCVEVPPSGAVSISVLNTLMKSLYNPTGGARIEAVKAYRILTGFGLKEAKEAIDAIWPPGTFITKEVSIGDIPNEALKR